MSKDERRFWNRSLQKFRKGQTIYKYKGVDHVTPWEMTDGSFSTIKSLEELHEVQARLENGENINEVLSNAGQHIEISDERTTNGGEPNDSPENSIIESADGRENQTV